MTFALRALCVSSADLSIVHIRPSIHVRHKQYGHSYFPSEEFPKYVKVAQSGWGEQSWHIGKNLRYAAHLRSHVESELRIREYQTLDSEVTEGIKVRRSLW